jgi:ribose transport system substrate-binding protein
MRKAFLSALAMLVVAIAATGCGGDDTSSAAGTSAAKSTSTTESSSVKAPPATPPTEIPITDPVGKEVPKGKSIIFLQCDLPSCARFVPGIKDGTAALGWKSKVEVFKSANPGAGLQQAVSEKPDYIAMTGIPVAAIKPQLAAAHKANIPVFSCGTADPPTSDGYAIQCGGDESVDADYMSRWAANDSGGKANILAVTIPQFSTLTTQTDWFKKNLSSVCPGCKYSELDVTVDDVGGGKVPGKVVAYLQAHPDVNYVHFTFGDLAIGAPAAVKAAGLNSKVKLIGAVENQAIVKSIAAGDGQYTAWTLSPNEYMGAVMVDAAARTAVGDAPGADYQKTIYQDPDWVMATPSSAKQLAATNNTWPGPEGYMDQFKKLWGVG